MSQPQTTHEVRTHSHPPSPLRLTWGVSRAFSRRARPLPSWPPTPQLPASFANRPSGTPLPPRPRPMGPPPS